MNRFKSTFAVLSLLMGFAVLVGCGDSANVNVTEGDGEMTVEEYNRLVAENAAANSQGNADVGNE